MPKTAITSRAHSLGFDAVGFTTLALPEKDRARLLQFIHDGEYGDMQWMADKAHLRADPKALWPEANSVIVVGHNYAPETNPLEKLNHKTTGAISCYAQNRDYHDIMKKKLHALAGWIAVTYGCEVKLFVDSAPILEKSLAAQAGIGWQGKHTCLVSREFGSWLFLGSIFTTLTIPSEAEGSRFRLQDASTTLRSAQDDNCGSCTKCLDICPTQAFTAERNLDPRRCIAYLTNEHKGQIPLEFRKAIGNRIYGCDDCLAVCPWNKFAQTAQESAYHAREELKMPTLKMLALLDDAAFRTLFSKSPIKRIGRDRFIRNVLVAIGNSNDPSLAETISPLENDASPLVSEMAAWAISELQKTSNRL